MDEVFFEEYLNLCKSIPEETHYLEVLNFSHPDKNISEWHSLSAEDFDNFLARKGVFAPPKLQDGVFPTGGLRLLLHQKAVDANTFAPHVLSLPKDKYQALIREWHLPTREIETSAVVSPFFWCDYEQDTDDKYLQIIFRKSDVQWKGTSRGWEMMLSYSFQTRITSGYVKGTEKADIKTLVSQAQRFTSSVAHPLLLPILALCREISVHNDKAQRDSRQKVRELEDALINRYRVTPAAGYAQAGDLILETIIPTLHDYQCRVLWKRPETWQKVVVRMVKANTAFWDSLTEEQRQDPDRHKIHRTMSSRLDFVAAKLEGLQSYTEVTLVRMNLLRGLVNSIIGQVESRLSVEIATQQHRLADASRRDSISMKTLSLLGLIFLPGTFLSSLFSMTFFDFGNDIQDGSVSRRIWIYFALMLPLTAVILITWWKYNQLSVKKAQVEDDGDIEARVYTFEDRILQRLRRKTGFRITAEGSRLVNGVGVKPQIGREEDKS